MPPSSSPRVAAERTQGPPPRVPSRGGKRGAKICPKGAEIVDDFLKTLIAGAKFYVPVKIVGLNAKAPVSTASPEKRKKPVLTGPEWRETIGGFSLGLAQNADKCWPSAEDFEMRMNGGEFWIYVSTLSELSFVYLEMDGKPGENQTS